VADRRRVFGDLGERLAVQHLEAKGYRIRQQNYRCAEGEIDIVAESSGVVAIVEVKCRRGASMGTAAEGVKLAKQRRLVALAEAYASEHAVGSALRIDVIAIDFARDGRMLSLAHYENAVTGD
jgi:putative endonuclease